MLPSPIDPPAGLDLDASARQAFGPSYSRPKDLRLTVAAYREGTLTMPPHPSWSGDPTNWTADPFQDRNWQFQHHTLRWLNALRWSALDGDEWARSEWLRVARSWFEANVPAERAASAFAWKDMADGNRAIQLSLGAFLSGPPDAWFIELLAAHRDWLVDETHIVGKNHGLHQHAGLFVVSAVLGDEHAMDTAVRRMSDQFATTFDAQGCNDEGSAAYHQMNLRWWAQSWRRVELEGRPVPDLVTTRLAAAGAVLAHLAQPDGRLPQIGDSSRGPVSTGLDDVADFAATQGRRGVKPLETVKILEGGYVISRSGWGETRPLREESHLVLRHGVDVRAHSHHDLGSVHLYAGGRPWLVDSGFHSYQMNNPIRRHLHSREAHNVAILPGLAHNDRSPVILERAEITDQIHDFVVVDRGYKSTEVRRRVIYLRGPDCWLVQDIANSASGVPLVQHWHADVGVAVRRHDRGFLLRADEGSVHLTWLGSAPRFVRRPAADHDLRGWIGTRWKTLKPGTLITAQATQPERGLAVLIAPAAGAPLGIVSSYVTTKNVLTATLVRGGKTWAVHMGDEARIEAV